MNTSLRLGVYLGNGSDVGGTVVIHIRLLCAKTRQRTLIQSSRFAARNLRTLGEKLISRHFWQGHLKAVSSGVCFQARNLRPKAGSPGKPFGPPRSVAHNLTHYSQEVPAHDLLNVLF